MKFRTHNLYRLGLIAIIFTLALGSAAVPVGATTRAPAAKPALGPDPPAEPTGVPAPPAGGPRPTLSLSPTHAYAGQNVVASGQGVAPYAGVRVAWLTGDATLTAAVVNVAPSGAYSASLRVPADAPAGPAKVCAAVTGTALAEFACAAFAIDTAPPGSVQGRIPLSGAARGPDQPLAIDAAFALVDQAGTEVLSATIQQDGSFQLDQVSPGRYEGIVRGEVPTIVGSAWVDLQAGQEFSIEDVDFEVVAPVTTCAAFHPDAAISSVTASPNGLPNDSGHFGTYLSLGASGAPVNVTFQASVQAQPGVSVTGVEFELTGPGVRVVQADSSSPYQAVTNVSQLAPGHYTLMAKPLGTACPGVALRQVDVIENPISMPGFVRDVTISWSGRYNFTGWIPDVGGLLPVVFPDPPPEILGVELENRLDLGLYFEGSLDLNGELRMRVLDARALVKLFGLEIYDLTQNMMPPGIDDVVWNLADPQSTYFPFSVQADLFDLEIPIFKYYWGIPEIADINIYIGIGATGGLVFEGRVYPLAGRLWAFLKPWVAAYIVLAVEAEILFGLGSAKASLRSDIGVGLPVNLDTLWDPPLRLGSPCIFLDLVARFEACGLWVFCDHWSETILHWDSPEGCHFSACRVDPANEPSTVTVTSTTTTRVLASPAIAGGPGGRMLSAYIEDTTPGQITPTSQVMARFWLTPTGAWGPPMALTDGSRPAHDPAVAFVGPDGHALAAWIESTLTAQEYAATGGSLRAQLARQELFYAYWDGTAWGAPQRLTDDAMPDAVPALAGDALGATLAWVRDTDGDNVTRTDWRIATTEWLTATRAWGTVDLLDASSVLSAPIPSTAAPVARAPSPPVARAPSPPVARAPSPPVARAPGPPVARAPGPPVARAPGPPPTDTDEAGGLGARPTFHVDSTKDEADVSPGDGVCDSDPFVAGKRCTLRAAIQEANALAGADAIQVPAGVYALAITGRGEDLAARGDLDIALGELSIIGAGVTQTIIDGNRLDTVFQVLPGASLLLRDLAVRNGDGQGLPSSAGGLNNAGTAILRNVSLSGHLAQGNGGGVVNQGTLTVRDSQVVENAAGGSGGGIYNASGALAVISSTVNSNQAHSGHGGGIAHAAGTLSVGNSTLAKNTAQLDGGGLWLAGNAVMTNTTLSLNTAGRSGGGISATAGIADLNNATIAYNQASSGGGVSQHAPAEIRYANTIIGSNTAAHAPDCLGTLHAQGYSLLHRAIGCSVIGAQPGDLSGRDPKLAPLDGEPTEAHALLYDSPAIDAGSPVTPGAGGGACEAADQHGFSRPQGPRCDIGAIEREAVDGVMNLQVDVARQEDYPGSSRTVLAWTADRDGDMTTLNDRRIVLAEKQPDGWSLRAPAELPTGADSPSLALGTSPELYLTFLARGPMSGGDDNAGLGNQAVVWSADYLYIGGGYGWDAGPLRDGIGRPVRGEHPLLAMYPKRGEIGLLFRQFGEAGTNGLLGQLAFSNRSTHGAYSAPLYVTDDDRQHWQPAMAINQATGQAAILQVTQPIATAQRRAPASAAALADVETRVLASGPDPLESITISATADPALDPALELSQLHAAPGTTILVTATARNVGREPSTGVQVSLYAGWPLTGTLLATRTVAGDLRTNIPISVSFPVTITPDLKTLTARLSTTGGNLSTANDLATAYPGKLPAPSGVNVSLSTQRGGALRVVWLPPSVEGVAGYRILRSETAGGPYELAGESTSPAFEDVLLQTGRAYSYVVQAYDARGARSIYSAEARGELLTYRTYTPSVSR